MPADIKVSLAEVELLTIRTRLLVCSPDKVQGIGLDWWRHDRELSSGVDGRTRLAREDVQARLRQLERKLELLTAAPPFRRKR